MGLWVLAGGSSRSYKANTKCKSPQHQSIPLLVPKSAAHDRCRNGTNLEALDDQAAPNLERLFGSDVSSHHDVQPVAVAGVGQFSGLLAG